MDYLHGERKICYMILDRACKSDRGSKEMRKGAFYKFWDSLRIKYIVVILLTIALSHSGLSAQKFNISTNLLEYVNLATLNLDASYAVQRHWSVNLGVKYNPFSYQNENTDAVFQNKQQSYSLGVRYWPWHIYSGWWLGTKLRYQEYNYGGFKDPITEEGDRYGMGVYAGYTYMLHKNINLEFGLGVWGGRSLFTQYSCPQCGVTLSNGKKYFVLPDDLLLSIVYVF